ncbi:two-component system sensor kinase FixL [Paraburkholderia sp. GAS334]
MSIVMSALVVLETAIIIWWLARSGTPRGIRAGHPHPAASREMPSGGPRTSRGGRLFVDHFREIVSARVVHRQAYSVAARSRVLPHSRADSAEHGAHDDSVEHVLELLPLPALILGDQGRIAKANTQTAVLFGYARDELPGKPFHVLVPEAQGMESDAKAHSNEVLTQEMPVAPAMRERLARRKDGTELRIELGLNTVLVDDRSVTLAFIVDRTDRYELLRNRQDLAHLTRVSTMGQLAGSLAHELNQPLTAILSNVQAAQRFMALDPVDLDEVREILSDIVKDDYRASEVIRRIRAVVKKGDLEVAPLDLAGVIRDVVFLLRSDAIVRGTRVVLDIDSDLQPVRGDRVQLQQVLLNLLLNAFDAMNAVPSAYREVRVTLKPDSHDMVRIAVRDYGHGLAPDRLDKIFKPFFTSKPQGLGLGLSICQSIVDMHRGRIWAENNVDRGATFYVTLPAGDTAEQDRAPNITSPWRDTPSASR